MLYNNIRNPQTVTKEKRYFMKKRLLCILLAFTLLIPITPVQADDLICDHDWSEWIIDYDATCGDTGQKYRYCYECDNEQTKIIPATGEHSWKKWSVTKKATVFKTGTKKRTCTTCKNSESKSIAKLTAFVKLWKTKLSLKQSKTSMLKASYANGDSIKSWKSNNTKVATVSKSGKITAKKAGKAKVTVTLKSGKKATCTIKVTAKTKKKTAKKTVTKTVSKTVYWVPNGGVYHRTINCPTLSRSKTIYKGSLSNCPKPRGCKVCY
jgi:hypothetical protein